MKINLNNNPKMHKVLENKNQHRFVRLFNDIVIDTNTIKEIKFNKDTHNGIIIFIDSDTMRINEIEYRRIERNLNYDTN